MARLSPLKERHVNFPGRCPFDIVASGAGSGLRPLRDPDAAEDADDGEYDRTGSRPAYAPAESACLGRSLS